MLLCFFGVWVLHDNLGGTGEGTTNGKWDLGLKLFRAMVNGTLKRVVSGPNKMDLCYKWFTWCSSTTTARILTTISTIKHHRFPLGWLLYFSFLPGWLYCHFSFHSLLLHGSLCLASLWISHHCIFVMVFQERKVIHYLHCAGLR